MKKLISSHDVIMPMAAIVGAPACDLHPAQAQAINYDAVDFILKNTSSDQKIIFPNTNSGYGIGEKNKE